MLKDLIRRTHVLEVILAFCCLLMKEKCNPSPPPEHPSICFASSQPCHWKKENKKGIKETGAEKIKPAQAVETHLVEMYCCVYGEEKQKKS